MTIKEFVDLDAEVRAIVEPLKRESLATITSVIVSTYGNDDRVKLYRTKSRIINMLLHSLFDLKENCDRNVPTW